MKHLKLKKDKKPVFLPLFVAAFALVGVALLLTIDAAPPVNNAFEPEVGSVASPATSGQDANASGGSYVSFQSAASSGCPIGKSGTPPNCTNTPQPAIIPTDPAILAAWRIVNSGGIAGPSPDEGAFRLICMGGQLLYDDPIVYPGQPGVSHLHMFFGNSAANAYSTFQSLRTTGNGSCQSGPINRSAYWIPAMLNGAGKVVMPDLAAVYYKGDDKTINLPRGLKYIAGDPLGAIPKNVLYGDANPGVVGGYIFHPYWRCVKTDGSDRAGTTGVGIPTCQPTDQLLSRLEFPFCWDGRLDSPNHRDHVIYPRYGSTGVSTCPSTHPTEIPRYTLQVFWTVAAGENTDNWYLSSDRTPSLTSPDGTSLHGDWFGAWDQTILELWGQECIREFRNCSASDFGDGTIGKQPTPWSWVNTNHLVDIPAKP